MSYRSISTTIWTISIITVSLLHSVPSGAKNLSKSQTFPTSGKVLKLTNGDLMCYVDLMDVRGRKHTLGADFEVCQQSKFLNKRVQLTYKKIKVSDCQSAEPCGKSKLKNAIVKMKLIQSN
jgi:hypothetical protein